MSNTFKDKPWRVKAAKWNAGNAEPWHTHHHYTANYEPVLDRHGKPLTYQKVDFIVYHTYNSYVQAMQQAGLTPETHFVFKPLDTPYESHDLKVWRQRVRDGYWDWASTSEVIVFRSVTTHPVLHRTPHPVVECTIDEPLNPGNDWGAMLPCTYYQRTPLGVVYAADRVARKFNSNKRNRRIGRQETRALTRKYNNGEGVDEYTSWVVRKANDWLG